MVVELAKPSRVTFRRLINITRPRQLIRKSVSPNTPSIKALRVNGARIQYVNKIYRGQYIPGHGARILAALLRYGWTLAG